MLCSRLRALECGARSLPEDSKRSMSFPHARKIRRDHDAKLGCRGAPTCRGTETQISGGERWGPTPRTLVLHQYRSGEANRRAPVPTHGTADLQDIASTDNSARKCHNRSERRRSRCTAVAFSVTRLSAKKPSIRCIRGRSATRRFVSTVWREAE